MSIKRILATAVALLLVSASSARANIINFSETLLPGGYAVVGFNVSSTALVDMTFTGGFVDPVFALFDGAGSHLILSTDANGGTLPHITTSLAPGAYALMVSYYTGPQGYLTSTGASYSFGDGVNPGNYWVGGSGTLAGTQADLDKFVLGYGGTTVSFAVAAAENVLTAIPEPSSMVLLSTGLVTAGLRRWRQRRP